MFLFCFDCCKHIFAVFLINVLRIILKIMHPTSTNPTPLNIRRTLRAAFILIPLLGLHVILLPFKPSDDSRYYKSYEYLSVILLSSQVRNNKKKVNLIIWQK